MALSFPLVRADFFNLLSVQTSQLFLPPQVNETQTAGGERLRSRRGVRLWQGMVTLAAMPRAALTEVEAKLALLGGEGASFLAYPWHRRFPKSDPDGSILGASSVTIQNLPAGGREIALQGLPVGYVLSPGDFLSFTYGSPAKYALHQIVVGSTAGAAGIASDIEVIPEIMPGAAVSDPVTLIRPYGKFLLDRAGPTAPTYDPVNGAGLGFTFYQSLR